MSVTLNIENQIKTITEFRPRSLDPESKIVLVQEQSSADETQLLFYESNFLIFQYANYRL